MPVDSIEDRLFLNDVSLSILAEVAPEELDLFDELAEEYYLQPTPPDLSSPNKEDQLAFGIEGLVVPVTPAVLAMVSAVFSYLATEFIDVTKEEGGKVVRQKTKELFARLFPQHTKEEEKPAEVKEIDEKFAKAEKNEQKEARGKEVENKKKPEEESGTAAGKKPLESLTQDQLKQIYKLAVKVARDFGMQPEVARNMAKALVGSTAMVG